MGKSREMVNQISVEKDNFVNSFALFYKKIEIGTLSKNSDFWIFNYSEEFKKQDLIAPLIGFSDKNKIYVSTQLWPFFESRIPSLRNSIIKTFLKEQNVDPNNKVLLLRRFGRKTITNPFVLEPIKV